MQVIFIPSVSNYSASLHVKSSLEVVNYGAHFLNNKVNIKVLYDDHQNVMIYTNTDLIYQSNFATLLSVYQQKLQLLLYLTSILPSQKDKRQMPFFPPLLAFGPDTMISTKEKIGFCQGLEEHPSWKVSFVEIMKHN